MTQNVDQGNVQGKVVNVSNEFIGSRLLVDHAVGANTLTMQDIMDFDDAGGSCMIGANIYTYAILNDDEDAEIYQLTITPSLIDAQDAGEAVLLYPAAYEKRAMVIIPGYEEAVFADVPHALQSQITDEIRDSADQETVTLRHGQGGWVIDDVVAQTPVVDGGYIDPLTLPPPSDGAVPLPPTGGWPAPEVIGGIGVIFARWPAAANSDPVMYDVFVGSTTPVPLDSAHQVGTTASTSMTIKKLAGAQTDTYNPSLQYGTTYYVRYLPRDGDGESPSASAEGSAQMVQITSPDIAADSVTGAHIIGGSITGDLFAGEIFMGSKFTTGAIDRDPNSSTYGEVIGQQVTMDPSGLRMTDANGDDQIIIPTDPGQTAQFKGQITTGSLRVIGGTSIESGNNEVAQGGTLQLSNGITTPTVVPTMQQYLDASYLDTTTPVPGNGQYALATGKFVPTDAQAFCVAGNNYMWSYNVACPLIGGVRVYYFNGDGTMWGDTSNPIYCYDAKDFVSITGIVAPENSATRNISFIGKYTGGQWYFYNGETNNFYKFTPLSSTINPTLGVDETGSTPVFFLCENSGGKMVIRRFTATGAAYSNIVITSTLTMGTSTATGTKRFAGALYGSFDYGSPRYVAKVTDDPGQYIVTGTGNGAALNTTEQWPPASNTCRGIGWDINTTAFYELSSNGVVYAFKNWKWTSSSEDYLWCGFTWYDSDAGGTGTHETKLGGKTYIKHKKRFNVRINMPTPPDKGGADDPDNWKLYMCTSSSTAVPADTAFHLQATSNGTYVLRSQTPDTATAAPPTINNFPGANPAQLFSSAQNPDSTPRFQVLGDGSGQWGPLRFDNAGNMTTVDDTGWINLGAFISAITIKVQPAYRIKNGIAYMRGAFTWSGSGGWTQITSAPVPAAALPIGDDIAFPTAANTGTQMSLYLNHGSGHIYIFSSAVTAAWFRLNMAWPVD